MMAAFAASPNQSPRARPGPELKPQHVAGLIGAATRTDASLGAGLQLHPSCPRFQGQQLPCYHHTSRFIPLCKTKLRTEALHSLFQQHTSVQRCDLARHRDLPDSLRDTRARFPPTTLTF